MIKDIDLRELAEREAPDREFLSVYVGGEDGAQAIDHRLDTLRATLEDDEGNGELEHFDENARLIRDYLAQHPPGSGTTCIFACFAIDFVRGYELELELPTDVRVGVAPYLRPLAELKDEYQTFAVVAADNHGTRVFLVTALHTELAGRVPGGVKNHVKKGGWSQKRYQRRRGNQLHHYAADVAEFLEQLAREQSFDRIVLEGSEETLVAIENALHESLREHVIAREPFDLKEGEEALVEDAFEHYFSAERREERELWKRIKAEYGADGLAALGPDDVLQAVQNGRVEAMVVDREAELPGRRCTECENTMSGEAASCAFCGAEALAEIDLVNELTRQAELTGADVEYADPIDGLARVGGVAALLRY